MPTKWILLFLIATIFSGCLGDAYIMVTYNVKNQTDKMVAIKGKQNSEFFHIDKDTIFFIPPCTNKTIYHQRYTCWFADCRVAIKNDESLDSLKYYFTDIETQEFKVNKKDWKIKKRKAILKIKN